MKISVALLLLFITGCSAQYTRNVMNQSLSDLGLKKQYQVTRGADWVLAANSKITVIPLSPESYPDIPRSVHSFNDALIGSFQKHFHFTDTAASFDESTQIWGNDIIILTRLGDMDDQLNSKIELFEGKFLHDDRKISRDFVNLDLIVFDARSLAFLDKVHVELKAAYFAETNQTPDNLIELALNRAVETLTTNRT